MSRFCKDCKHSRVAEDLNPYSMKCAAPENFIDNVDQSKYLVTGIEQPVIKAQRGSSCTALRIDRQPGVITCGSQGEWFVAKEQA